MDMMTRIGRLAEIINAAGGAVVGKKKLQKLIYLAQEKGLYLGYDFEYYFHGVFCSDIETDLRIAKNFGVLNQEQEFTNEFGNPVRVSVVDKEACSPEPVDAERQKGLELVEALAPKSARVLEVLSTIVYLTNAGYNGKERDSHLHRLKGHLEEFFSDAQTLYNKHFEIPGAGIVEDHS